MEQENNFEETRRKESVENETFVTGSEDEIEDTVEQIKQSGSTDVGSKTDNSLKSEKHNEEQLHLDLLSQKSQEGNKFEDRLSCNISDFSIAEYPESAPKTVVNDTTGAFDVKVSEHIVVEDNEEMPLVPSSTKCFEDSNKISSFDKNSAAENYEKLSKENTLSNSQELISGETNDTVKYDIKRNDAPLLHQLLQTTATLPYPTKCGLMCKQAASSCGEKNKETPIKQINEQCESQTRSEDTAGAEMIIDEPMLTPLIARHMENELEDHEDQDMDSQSPVIELFDEEDATNIQEKEHDCEEPNDCGSGQAMDVDESENRKADTKIKKVLNKDSKTDVECINFECERIGKKFIIAPNFALNLYKVTKKINKIQYVCEECYDKCIDRYQKLCQTMCEKKPLYVHQTPRRQEFVEILDSSDEEEENVVKDEEPPLTPETISMVEDDLNSIISNVLCRVDISAQLNWTTNILKEKINKFDELADELCNEFSLLHKKANYMYNTLYQYPKIKIKELPPIDLNTGKPYSSDVEHNLPPWGELIYSRIEIGCVYFAARNKPIGSWLPCTVIEALGGGPDKQKPKSYKVKFKGKVSTIKSLPPKHMAYGEAPKIRLKIGSRVIALFDAATLNRFKDKSMQAIRNAFYPGVVAEELQAYNKYRYLIFFDDGYAQYVNHKDVRIVCESSENVWEDVHEGSREFIRTYLNQDHKNRPMVQVKKGQSMTTESNGKWLYAKVLDIDASLVLVYFSEENRCEWIYLGSCRLGPLYKERQKRLNFYQQSPQLARRTGPFVSYTQNYEAPKRPEQPPTYRAVARKSTARPESQNLRSTPVKHLNNSTIYLEDEKKTRGKIIFYTTKTNMPSKRYVAHECSPKCIFRMPHNVNSYSPLVKPMISGWERNLFSTKGKYTVVYRAPCGLRLRNMDEVHKYLRKTENPLNVDNFNFVEGMHCLAEYVIEDYTASKPDLSNGVENVPLQCLNYYDSTLPPECRYSTKRIPTKGVKLNLDPAFLAGCDCEDDCSDKSKCACWQLTLQGAKFGNPNTPPENVGYVYKRLLDQVPTGIYECNVNCKCSKSCLNRVAQWPLQLKLQVFKTSNRGWGLRCLTDVPKGTFICIYAGHLLTEQMANEGGLHSGDEYFAELDYIEVVERLKEGYESDVPDDVESDEDLDEPAGDNESDEEFRSSASFNRDASINTRLRAKRGVSTDDPKYKLENRTNKGIKSKKSSYYDDDGDVERKVINFEPNTSLDNEASNSSKYRSVRKYFGKNEYCYVMDAKKTGNLGRYFNHSCSPNLFVQNVFVDTHDLRFPWVAFFALKNIRAGTELTWNYNYEVGIVPGKVLYCECGAPNCRGRLL